MQTFLPYPDFEKSAHVLDDKRLNKQIVETYQILRILCGLSSGRGWRSHPAVNMWKTYECALYLYWSCCINEWVSRSNFSKFYPLPVINNCKLIMPYWFGDLDFHLSHQSNLVRKEIQSGVLGHILTVSKIHTDVHYRSIFGDIPNNINYIWPKPISDDKEYICKNRNLVEIIRSFS